MSIGELGSFGEFVASIGVIVSLVYLAIQERRSASWQKRQGFQGALESLRDAGNRIGQNARVYNSGCSAFCALDEDERLLFVTMISAKYAAIELFHDFDKSGDVKSEAIEALNEWLRSDFDCAGIREWWELTGRTTFSPDFARAVDDVVGPAPPELLSRLASVNISRRAGW